MAVCKVCFRHCSLDEGMKGFCGARICEDGRIKAENYGRITSLALDPIEKKPLRRFYPGSMILSAGSYGCNLRCPFCQNSSISWAEEAFLLSERTEYMSPEDLAGIAVSLKKRRNIGLAFTYNEPLISYEYIKDTAALIHEAGMKSVIVTNGTADVSVMEEIAPYIDAMNIDLKGFTDSFYSELLHGDFEMVRAFISLAVQHCHVELTTLIIPGENDSEEEMIRECEWIAGLKDASGNVIGDQIPLHISRFFPSFKMRGKPATDVDKIYSLAAAARKTLKYVYTGNC